jgi:hypothetical protein
MLWFAAIVVPPYLQLVHQLSVWSCCLTTEHNSFCCLLTHPTIQNKRLSCTALLILLRWWMALAIRSADLYEAFSAASLVVVALSISFCLTFNSSRFLSNILSASCLVHCVWYLNVFKVSMVSLHHWRVRRHIPRTHTHTHTSQRNRTRCKGGSRPRRKMFANKIDWTMFANNVCEHCSWTMLTNTRCPDRNFFSETFSLLQL